MQNHVIQHGSLESPERFGGVFVALKRDKAKASALVLGVSLNRDSGDLSVIMKDFVKVRLVRVPREIGDVKSLGVGGGRIRSYGAGCSRGAGRVADDGRRHDEIMEKWKIMSTADAPALLERVGHFRRVPAFHTIFGS